MARIDALPAITTIMGLKGQIDYAVWRGLPYVRSWPRKPQHPRAPAVKAQIETMVDYIHRLNSIAPAFVAAAREETTGTTWTWRDATITSAWGHLFK